MKTKWIIKISGEANFLVKEGDMVVLGELLAKVKPKEIESFNFSQFFGKLSESKLKDMNQKFKNSWVNSGDLLCLTGGIFPNKLCFPMSGNFLEIDEFGNLRIEKIDTQEKEIVSPINSKVIKIEDDKIILEFEAQEFKGEGKIEGKSWGNAWIMIIDENKDLNSEMYGGILFTNNLSRSFLLKAEVVGIVGVVTNQEIGIELINSDLPLLKLDDDDWDNLMKHKGQKRRMLLNSRVGRLLMVVE